MEQINSLNSKNKSEVRNMLNNLYSLFLKKFRETQKAWDYFLEFIAMENSAELIFQSDHDLDWLFDDKRFRDSVFSVYDSELLKSVYYDYLGDFYFDIIKKEPIQQTLPEKIRTQIMTKCNEKKNSIKVLDLYMGTGRNLMAIHKVAPNATLFGITNDLNLFRIALTNSIIFQIKCFLLHADNNTHELELNSKEGINNWKHANKWNWN